MRGAGAPAPAPSVASRSWLRGEAPAPRAPSVESLYEEAQAPAVAPHAASPCKEPSVVPAAAPSFEFSLYGAAAAVPSDDRSWAPPEALPLTTLGLAADAASRPPAPSAAAPVTPRPPSSAAITRAAKTVVVPPARLGPAALPVKAAASEAIVVRRPMRAKSLPATTRRTPPASARKPASALAAVLAAVPAKAAASEARRAAHARSLAASARFAPATVPVASEAAVVRRARTLPAAKPRTPPEVVPRTLPEAEAALASTVARRATAGTVQHLAAASVAAHVAAAAAAHVAAAARRPPRVSTPAVGAASLVDVHPAFLAATLQPPEADDSEDASDPDSRSPWLGEASKTKNADVRMPETVVRARAPQRFRAAAMSHAPARRGLFVAPGRVARMKKEDVFAESDDFVAFGSAASPDGTASLRSAVVDATAAVYLGLASTARPLKAKKHAALLTVHDNTELAAPSPRFKGAARVRTPAAVEVRWFDGGCVARCLDTDQVAAMSYRGGSGDGLASAASGWARQPGPPALLQAWVPPRGGAGNDRWHLRVVWDRANDGLVAIHRVPAPTFDDTAPAHTDDRPEAAADAEALCGSAGWPREAPWLVDALATAAALVRWRVQRATRRRPTRLSLVFKLDAANRIYLLWCEAAQFEARTDAAARPPSRPTFARRRPATSSGRATKPKTAPADDEKTPPTGPVHGSKSAGPRAKQIQRLHFRRQCDAVFGANNAAVQSYAAPRAQSPPRRSPAAPPFDLRPAAPPFDLRPATPRAASRPASSRPASSRPAARPVIAVVLRGATPK
ncbi:hypothetical protein M885DRAFT_617622 [Pelagophyceae sp. CCMP2097]|nr:hypothetical protein M885DRAFT_617622 [Pelagophyceae sp. CCMP2097]